MGNLRKVVVFLFGAYFLMTQASDKYNDGNRPYEFGFTIDGEQHRHEKKDENGIVMGEFGFITADGVYHVTVYATDEKGHFKILSMKNIRVKPYPTSPEAGIKKSKSSTISAPQKDSIPESTNEEKTIKKEVASPAKSCSHCLLPTTTTTTVSPAISQVSAKFTNTPSTENYNHNQNNNNVINKSPILLQNVGDQQKDYNSKTHQSNPQTADENNRQEEQNNNNNSQNGNLLPLQNLSYQEPNFKPIIQSQPQSNIDNQSHLQQDVVSNNPVQDINPKGEQYLIPQNRHLSTNQQKSVPDVKQNNLGVSNVSSIDPLLLNLDYQEPNFKPIIPQSYPQTNIDNQSHLQQDAVSNNPVQTINSEREQYLIPQNRHLSTNQQKLVPYVKQNNPGVSNVSSIDPPLLNLDYQELNFKPIIPQSYPQTNIDNQSHLQQDVISNNPVQTINPEGEQYLNTQNIHLSTNQQTSVPDVKQNNPGVSNVGTIDSPPIQNPISRNLQGPKNEDYLPNPGLPQNKQADNGVKNYNQNVLNNNNKNDYSEAQSYPQQQNYEEGSNIKEPNKLTISSPPTINSRQAIEPHNEGEKSALGNPKGERTPKSFGDFIQQSTGPEEFASTGPNLYRPSLPNPSDFSGKPVLLAAQIQKADINANIHNKNPGENDGLPEGITEDDVTNLLYTFNYTVGFHGHHEKGYSNGAKQGYYYVTGRNGVRTRVDYVADEKGFRPKITQEILDIVSDEVPKPETEKDEKYGLKGYEFKWLYFPVDQKSK